MDLAVIAAVLFIGIAAASFVGLFFYLPVYEGSPSLWGADRWSKQASGLERGERWAAIKAKYRHRPMMQNATAGIWSGGWLYQDEAGEWRQIPGSEGF